MRRRNRFSEQRQRLSADGGPALLDLSASNPTHCGIGDNAARIALLANAKGRHYAPLASGDLAARQALTRYYQRRGIHLEAEAVLLTASTSDAYSYLFKLLCDPGDSVLFPQPGYPLFPYLARLEGIVAAYYPAIAQEGYRIDLAALRQRLDENPRCRAVIVVHPNNPTGALVRKTDADALVALLAERGVALIVDEVFADYPFDEQLFTSRRRTFAGEPGCLCFVLSGLSKVALLPQAKLAWLVSSGPAEMLREARARLELIADCYLSLATAPQLALPKWISTVEPLQQQLRQRLRHNLAALDAAIVAAGETCPLRRLPSDAGWYALVQVPRTRSDEEWALRLLEQHRVVVQPGYFYDIAEAGVMVVSLLLPPERFREGIERAVDCWQRG